MGISVEFINNLLKDYDSSGQKKRGRQWRRSNTGFSESTKRVALKNISPYLNDEVPNAPGSYYSYVERLKTYLYMYIHRYIKSFPLSALTHGELVTDRIEYGGGRHHTDRYVDIYVDPDALWRDSLWNTSRDMRVPANTQAQRYRLLRAQAYWATEKQKYGVNNILTLFEYGWHTTGRVQGKWHNAYTWNRQHMTGTYMLHEAIATFNQLTPRGITATLGMKYS